MFSIYRRFDGDVKDWQVRGEARMPLARNEKSQAAGSFGQKASGMLKPCGQDVLLAKNMGQMKPDRTKCIRQGTAHSQNPYMSGMQKALPPAPLEKAENQKNEHSKCAKKKNFGLLQGILPRGVYDAESKKLFGVLTAEDLLLVALIFLMLEKDGEENMLVVLALVYVLLADYIDLPELGF